MDPGDKYAMGTAGTGKPSGYLTLLFSLITVICVLVALVAIILSAVSMSKPAAVMKQQQGQTAGQGQTTAGQGQTKVVYTNSSWDRVWTIAVGHDWESYEYVDTSGFLKGFNHDLIWAVCAAAGMNCATVWDPYTNCWDSVAGEHPRAGKGLMGRWYDACTGWSGTTERVHVFKFSKPHLGDYGLAFYTKIGATFNPLDIRNKLIGFLDGWVTDEKCLARLTSIKGNIMPVGSIQHKYIPMTLKEAILNGSVDAGFTGDAIFNSEVTNNELRRIPVDGACSVSGGGMMTRKDNNFNDYWNYGLDKLMANGQFAKLCDNAHNMHGRGEVECVKG